MTIRQQLWQEINSSSDEILAETLDFLQFLKNKQSKKASSPSARISTGKSLLQHLKTLPNWSGNDLEESLQSVKETRSPAKFDLDNLSCTSHKESQAFREKQQKSQWSEKILNFTGEADSIVFESYRYEP